MKNTIFLLIVIILSGITWAQCGEQLQKVNSSINQYNTLGGHYLSSVSRAYSLLAICYEANQDHEKALAACSKCKEWAGADIEWIIKEGRSEETIADSYSAIADCYKGINERDEACEYCLKSNRYLEKPELMFECKFYGCPEDSRTAEGGKESGTMGSMFLIIGLVVLLLIIGVVFLLKMKK